MVTGKTLIDLGYVPARWFGQAIAFANEHSPTDEQLHAFIGTLLPPPVIPCFDAPKPYYLNIEGETSDELSNIELVTSTMDVLMTTPTVVSGAVMPDACPTGEAGQIPVGGVVVTKNAIHPSMHSADVCCSVMMTNLGHVDPKEVMDAAFSITHFGGGGRQDVFEFPESLELKFSQNKFLKSERANMLARTNLGTQGDGNHFLYVGTLESTGETILVTHHGSRGVGAYLYKSGMAVAEKYRKQLSPDTLKRNAWIPYDTPDGEAYWEALQLVREWTKINHTVLHDAVSNKVGASLQDRFWNEHNFVFKDEELFYHAKGATPLLDKFVPDSSEGRRLIPLNMSEPILIVSGEGGESSLGFAPHGAGRNVSRSAHIRSKQDRTIEEVFAEETVGLDVRFFSGNIDISELPSAYKNAKQVQEQMERFDLGKVLDKILPYGSIMAGDWQKDAPWKRNKTK